MSQAQHFESRKTKDSDVPWGAVPQEDGSSAAASLLIGQLQEECSVYVQTGD